MDWAKSFSMDAAAVRGSEIRELLKVLADPQILSFAGGIPDPALFPLEECTAIQSRLQQDEKAFRASFQYSQTEGYTPLRSWIADQAGGEASGIGTANTLVTNGAQQSLSLLAKALINPGDRLSVANPTYLGALQVFGSRRPDYLTVATDQNGLIPEAVEEAFKAGAKILYTIPDFQNPGGFTLSEERRHEILALAHEYSVIVIEDTAYSALYFDAPPPPSLFQLECQGDWGAEDRLVVQLGTFSKTLMPALRVGWTLAPVALIEKLVILKQADDLHTSTMNQIVGHELASTILAQHMSGLRHAYGQRRDAMMAALDQWMPDTVRYTRPGGGMFVWLELPEGLSGVELLKRALNEEKLAFVPGGAFHADGSGANTIRLCFSTCSAAQIDDGIRRLAGLIKAA
ncbi:PLP-dependent aminotransferase family protein [Aestuariispira insulae]|uniref:DNA-binding transcriptional MocR family regulator n=1 Tax=Aestuariispira insulae TaxID=1461337 RepID=A0A3D9HX09_9PROT|nr:PLP-dependent aminotransferase family protein [Aestuariispira insulae]RED53940.1 DNA-binding transcriptional MocR family regulator [Aestuariispira insulae]